MVKIIQKILRKALFWFNRKDLMQIQKARLEDVEAWLHNHLPENDDSFVDQVIIREGTYNYFLMPDGKLPKIHYVLPTLALFVYVGDHKTISWSETAQEYGISRKDWQQGKKEFEHIEKELRDLELGTGQRPIVLMINWETSTDPFTLTKLLKFELEK